MSSSGRDDFSSSVLSQVARRAAYRCSMCRVVTIGPSDESAIKISTIGVACHITAAAPGGPRYDPSLSPDQRRAIENAIWMCNNHSRLIDSDTLRYTVAKLQDMKARHEAFIKAELEGANSAPERDVSAWVSDALLSWPTTLPGGAWLTRNELERIHDELETAEPRAVVVLGAPGSGKSSLMARLGARLREQDVNVVAIKADRIPKTVASQEALASWTGASEPLERILRHRALSKRTVLLVDQLDALADLVDLETARLDVILELLDSVRAVPNLHLVVSCRGFEFRHDLRMRRLDAEAIELALPTWEQVAPVLKARGLDATGWPDRLRELLLVPQQLKVFLQVAGSSPPSFASYQSMLEELWSSRVKGDPQRVEIVNRLASQMAADEVLVAPVALVDDLPPRLLADLVAGGILRQDATTVTFAHQSLFEFARARTFATGDVSLVEYVMQRQSGLFVRPIIWSGLTYLRGARPAEYERSFLELWQRSDIRLHVRVLLGEFLGQLDAPNADELAWLSARLDDVAVRRAALTAMQGSPRWFERVSPILPGLLERDWTLDLVGLLCGAASFAPSRIVDLLEAHWTQAPATRQACIHVSRFLGTWDERSVSFVIRLLSTERIDAEGIFATVAEAAPHLAPRMLAAIVSLALDGVHADLSANPPKSEFDGERRYEAALDRGTDLVDLRALARHSPRQYLVAVFPVFERVASILAVSNGEQSYRQADIGFARDAAARFFEAVVAASEQLARESPAEFLAFADSTSASDVAPVHRVLATGLAALPSGHHRAALAYLRTDQRRLRIGTGTEPDETSVALLGALADSLSIDDAQALEAMALGSSLYEPVSNASPSAKRACLSLNRAHRARLLRSLPIAFLSTESRMLIDAEATTKCPSRTPRGYKFGAIESPMSAEQMIRARDAHLLKLFSLLTDDTEWRHPHRDLEGGSIEASRAFGELAKRKPERVAALVEQLAPETQERPVAHALSGIAEVGWDREEWERLVLSCDARGFRGEEFRWHVAGAVSRRAQNEAGASDALCAMLQRWLDESPIANTDPSDDEGLPSGKGTSTIEGPTARPRHSLLFGLHGGGVLPRGNYPAVHGLFCGLMFRSPPAIERFLDLVERQLPRRDPAIEWYWLCRDLRHISLSPDRTRAAQFLRALFASYPEVLESEAGALLVAHSIWWIDRNAVKDWIESLRAAATPTGRQAAGELLVLASSLGVELDLEQRLAHGDTSVDERVGIALAIAHQWYEASFRHRATGVLLELLADADAAVREGALSVIGPQEELPVDEPTRKLLDAISSHPELTARLPNAFFEQAHLLLPVDAARVATIVAKFLDAIDAGLRSDRSWLMIGPELMRTAVTLQRLFAFREAGMTLFERLLAKGVYGIDEVLFDLDGRPRPARPRASSPRRSRATRGRARRPL